jgi:hypothetical protein
VALPVLAGSQTASMVELWLGLGTWWLAVALEKPGGAVGVADEPVGTAGGVQGLGV